MLKSAISQWSEAKARWNHAFTAACAAAKEVAAQVESSCGQKIDPRDILAGFYSHGDIPSGGTDHATAYEFGSERPVTKHWHGTIGHYRSAAEALSSASHESLMVIAREILLR